MSLAMQEIVEHHTLTGGFILSSGKAVSKYIDFRDALLCEKCTAGLVHYYYGKIIDQKNIIRERELGLIDAIVGTGIFGGMMLSQLRSYSEYNETPEPILWNKKVNLHGEIHGVEWSGNHFSSNIQTVILIDDIRTTGETLERMRQACEEKGWDVVGEIVYDPSIA